MPVCMSVRVGRGQEAGEMTTGVVVCNWLHWDTRATASLLLLQLPVRLE